MYIGNIMLLILNLPLIRFWVKIIQMPYYILAALILVCSTTACYASNGNIFDLYVMFGFGLFGWFVSAMGFSVAPILLGLILGPLLETNLRNALVISNGDPTIFVTRPISLVLLIYTLLALVFPVIHNRRRKKKTRNA
jgi:putative tricarboxylic transport membrane protein